VWGTKIFKAHLGGSKIKREISRPQRRGSREYGKPVGIIVLRRKKKGIFHPKKSGGCKKGRSPLEGMMSDEDNRLFAGARRNMTMRSSLAVNREGRQ